jgi:hypothetical protein
MEECRPRPDGRRAAEYMGAFRLASPSPKIILKELRLMGISAKSLFPGLDGVCAGVFEDADEP